MLTVYCFIALIANVLAIVFLHDHLNLSELSIVPALTLALSIFDAVYFHNHRELDEQNTAYSQNSLNEEEWAKMMPFIRDAFIAVIPLHVPLVCFFPSWVKISGSLVLVAVGFFGGAVAFRIKHQKEVLNRVSKEKQELEEQKRREELGRWK